MLQIAHLLKMDKKLIIIILLSLIILGMVGTFIYKKIINQSLKTGYNIGFKDANILINQQIETSLKQKGFIVFNFQINSTNYIPIKLVPAKIK